LSVNVVSSRLLQLYWPLQRGRRTGGSLALAQGYSPHLTAGIGRPALARPDRSAAFSSRALLPSSPSSEKAKARQHDSISLTHLLAKVFWLLLQRRNAPA